MLNDFDTIIAECNYGQPIKGVEQGGHVIANMFNLKPVLTIEKDCFKKIELPHNGYYMLSRELQNIHTINRKTLLLGGDHSIGISSVDAMLNLYGDNLRILWIDAHADINDYISSKTGNIHGMPLGFHHIGTRNIIPWNERQRRLKSNQLFYYGIRELDDFEAKLIKTYKINNTNVINNDIIDFIKTAPKLMISLDVDSMDPEYISSTGTRACNGITPENIKELLDLAKQYNLVHMDITELNPEIGNIDESVTNLKKIFL